jgi:hypothetical protein
MREWNLTKSSNLYILMLIWWGHSCEVWVDRGSNQMAIYRGHSKACLFWFFSVSILKVRDVPFLQVQGEQHSHEGLRTRLRGRSESPS